MSTATLQQERTDYEANIEAAIGTAVASGRTSPFWVPDYLIELAHEDCLGPERRQKIRAYMDRLDDLEPLMSNGEFSPEIHHMVDDDREEETHTRTLEALGRMRVSGKTDDEIRWYAGAICQRQLDDEAGVEFLRAIPG